MSVVAVETLGAALAPPVEAPWPLPAVPQGTGFADWVGRELSALNAELLSAEQGVQQLAAANAHNLHEVMLQLEQARLGMQLASQIRSRVLEAYQEVMRMQV
jgi:flagellar hook-basal body complex protein FliE